MKRLLLFGFSFGLVACGPTSQVTTADQAVFDRARAHAFATGASPVAADRIVEADEEAARAKTLADAEEAHEAMALATASVVLAEAETARARAFLDQAHRLRTREETRENAQLSDAIRRDKQATQNAEAADRELLRDAMVPQGRPDHGRDDVRRDLAHALTAEAHRFCAVADLTQPGTTTRITAEMAQQKATTPSAVATKNTVSASDPAIQVSAAESFRNACISAIVPPTEPAASALLEALPASLKPFAHRDRRGLVLRGSLETLKSSSFANSGIFEKVKRVIAAKNSAAAARALGQTDALLLPDETLGTNVEWVFLAADR